MYTSVKNRVFSHDMHRAGMVIGIGKVCAVHQRPCVVVPAYLPTVEVLDHDVVWWLTKFFLQNCHRIRSTSSHFFFLNRKQLLSFNRKKKLHNFIYFSRIRKTCFTSTKFRGFENKQTKNYFFTWLRVLCYSRVPTETLRIFHTPHFLHSAFSTLRTPHSALRTPRFPLNRGEAIF